MWESISTMFLSLPDDVRWILAIAGVPTGLYVLKHIRKDKQGHWYWFQQRYEDQKWMKKLESISVTVEDTKKSTASLSSKVDRNLMEIERLRILNLIQHNPDEKVLISKEYDKYKCLGGNGYIDDIYRKYMDGR